jgi:hypothetical protein
MRLGDVDDKKGSLVFVVLVELVEGGNLPPERRSSVTSEHEHDGALLRGEIGEAYLGAFIELGQGKIRGPITYL